MTDVRARFAEVLQEHRSMSSYGGGVICTARGCMWKWSPSGSIEQHQTDVLLSLPGIAIVELPEQNPVQPEWPVLTWDVLDHSLVYVEDGLINHDARFHDSSDARALAAALLAAANAAEQADTDA